MAFILEDGTGVVAANAYISATEMRAYWSDVGVTFTQTDSELQVAIIKATRYVELRNQTRWKGEREFPETPQGLSWPRLYVPVSDSPVCEDYYEGVPTPLKNAIAEYAQRAVSGTLLPDPTQDPFVTQSKVKAGPIETETRRLPGFQTFAPIPSAELWLKPLVYAGNYTMR
jgi:hypothetical protein